MILAIIAIANIIYYTTQYFTRPPHVRYPAFGIEIPQGYTLHGIDVSRYQQVINWEDVKKMQVKNIRIGFVFIKATEGTDRVDAQFSRNWQQAGEQDIPKGAYHYFIANRSGKAQASNFIEMVKLKKGDLPPVLDMEEVGTGPVEKLRAGIREWLMAVEKEYGVKPLLYTNIHFYNSVIRDSFEDYPVWVAHYLQPGRPRIDRKWTFWQHNESGHVNGIQTKVDFNVFSGDSADFKNLLIR